MSAPLREVAPAPVLAWDRDSLTVELPRLGPTAIGLRGRHQAHNAALAHATLDALGEAGIASVPDEVRRRGFRTTAWAGRLELLTVAPGRDVLLDGAHNAAGAAALATALDDLRSFLAGGAATPPGRLTLLMAMMADKDVASAVANLARAEALRGALVVATEVEGGRALAAGALAAIWAAAGDGVEVVAEPSLDRALELALGRSRGTIVVAGSLYLVGAVRERMVDDPRLRDPGADSAS